MTTKAKAEKARQRLARGRQELRKADAALAKEKRRLDTRRKALAGSVLLDVILPNADERFREQVGEVIGKVITRNNRKSAHVREEELELFRDVFGEGWFQRWTSQMSSNDS